MKHNEQQAMLIAEEYKKKYPNLTNKIVSAKFQPTMHNDENDIWIVNGKFELFGDQHDFFYFILDKTGLVEYTMNDAGSINPHLPVEIDDEELKKEWDEFDEDEHNRNNYYQLVILKVCYENGISTIDYLEDIFLKLGIVTQIGDVIEELKDFDLLDHDGLFENETSGYKSLRITESGIQYFTTQIKYVEIEEDLFSKETEEKLMDFLKD